MKEWIMVGRLPVSAINDWCTYLFWEIRMVHFHFGDLIKKCSKLFLIFEIVTIMKMWDLPIFLFKIWEIYLGDLRKLISLLRLEIVSLYLFDMNFEIENGCWLLEISCKLVWRLQSGIYPLINACSNSFKFIQIVC